MAACWVTSPKLTWHSLVKRSWALRGRNPIRDNQVDGAPKVHQAPGGESHRGSLLDAIGHRSHASENPTKFAEGSQRPLETQAHQGAQTHSSTLAIWRRNSFTSRRSEAQPR